VYTKILVGKPEGKRPLGRIRRRWEKIPMKQTGKGGMWTGLSWRRIGANGELL